MCVCFGEEQIARASAIGDVRWPGDKRHVSNFVVSVAMHASAFHSALEGTKTNAPVIGTRGALRANPSALELI